MKDTSADDTVIERLKLALGADTLPKAARDYAAHLLNRLSQPVRVTVLGTPSSGKTQLINMFVGKPLVPDDAKLPTTEFAWGETESMTVTAADGTATRLDSTDFSTLAGQNAAFLRVELPVSILQRVNLLEVVTEGTAEELSSGVDWAVRRTDIALWCTQAFGKKERAVWSRVPDSLKDHAFLVLTKADDLSAQKLLSKRVSELETVVAEEFHSLFAVATLQAIRAFGPDGIDETLFHASGGGALTSEVLRHAERGRRADFDSAHMFLARYQVQAGDRVSSRPRSVPVVAEPAERTRTAPTTLEVADAARSKPEQITPVTAENVAPAPPTKVENVELFSDAIRYLKRRGDGLAKSTTSLEEGSLKPLIDQCVDVVEHLTDLFSQDESGCEAADNFIDELTEASEIMVLMQVEDGDAPAVDAVTLLLQLRRDMEMQLAA